MPKIFFFDVWLRNAILKNFENINDRFDKWQFFENIVWKEFIFKYKIDDIKYWRTKDNNEIDFIIEDNNAFEVKFSEDLIRESKYKLFKEKYANIPLEFITFENLIEKIIIFMHN
jgi:predicted AAA+ superfamily ATPase